MVWNTFGAKRNDLLSQMFGTYPPTHHDIGGLGPAKHIVHCSCQLRKCYPPKNAGTGGPVISVCRLQLVNGGFEVFWEKVGLASSIKDTKFHVNPCDI